MYCSVLHVDQRKSNIMYIAKHTIREIWRSPTTFLRATAVPAGTAERVLATAILSVRLSVRLSRPGTESSPGEIGTPGFYHMIA